MRVDVWMTRRSLRAWHVDLVDRLGREPGIEARVRWQEAEDEPLPAPVGLLFALERIVHRLRPGLSAPASPAELDRHVAASEGGPDVILDLTGTDPPAARRRWRLTFDGGSGEAPLLAALLAGRLPILAISDIDTGAVIASGRPGAERRDSIVASFEDVLARATTLILAALGTPSPCRLPGVAAPAALASADVVRFGAKALARAAMLRVYRILYRAPHWRTGWRIVTGPDVIDLCRHPEEGWRDLPDDGLRFYADPFPIVVRGETWVFVEDLEHRTGKGVISAVRFDERGPAGPPRPVLEEPHHLSYPCVFEHGGTIWMVPESSARGTVDLYRATAFPGGWVREATLLDGLTASDATPFRHEDRWWMTATVRDGGGYSDALHLWSAESLTGPWRAHPGNPVLIDAATARPAGHVVRRGGRLVRPVQDCSTGYGAALALAEITRLDESGFEQAIVARLGPGPLWPGRRLHTLNRAGRIECIDGSAVSPRFLPGRSRPG